MAKIKTGMVVFLVLLVIVLGIIDFLVPQLPAVSILEGINEALQIVAVVFLGVLALMRK